MIQLREASATRARETGGRLRFGQLARIGLLVGLVTLLLPTASLLGSGTTDPTDFTADSSGCGTSVCVNLTIQSTHNSLSPLFWGSTVSVRAPLLSSESNLITATPTQVLVWPGAGAGDDYNPLPPDMRIYNASTGAATSPSVNESTFVSMCQAIHCIAIFQLPGEINNTSVAVAIMNYTEHNLGFIPAYWEIGNEPGLWTHYNLPWSQWKAGQRSGISASGYAQLVQRYIIAIRHYFNPADSPIIGLPGYGKGGSGLSQWINDTVQLNGPNISAVAIHEYPANGASYDSLTAFYQTLHSSASVPARVTAVRAWVNASEQNNTVCVQSGCSIPLFLTEIGSALSHKSYSNNASSFPGALDMAAQITQAMTLNVTNVDLYASVLDTVNSWFTVTGVARPVYTLYTTILSHLGSQAYPVSLLSSVPTFDNTLYGIATVAPSAGGRNDLMVVNTNVSTSAKLTLHGGHFNSPTEVWSWTNLSSFPKAAFYGSGVPSSFPLPPQSLVLFETYPRAAAPLQFNEVGLNLTEIPEQRWFVDVNGTLSSSAGTNLTLFLPAGQYPASAPALPVNRSAQERFEPFAPTPVVVGTGPTAYPLPFARQWTLTTAVDPVGSGRVAPSPGWVNASLTISLTATASPGFLFSHWAGSGPGNFTGPGNPATVTLSGPVTEKAVFVGGYPVTFSETGLPAGTNWSVTVRGVPINSTSSNITFQEANSTYGYQVGAIPGFRAHPPAGSFLVQGAPVEVPIAFQPITPPGQRYPVTFVETGLSAGTNWSVTVRNDLTSSTSANITFQETNGTFGFQVGSILGYRAYPPAGSFLVQGGPVEVPIVFQATTPPGQRFPVTFGETGLPAGTLWSVSVRGFSNESTSTTITFLEANGTSGYQVGALSGYRAHPPAGSFLVDGRPVQISIVFVADTPPGQRYPVTFVETGLPNGTNWSVTVRGVVMNTTSTNVTFLEANGTVGYQVSTVSGYRAHPPAGSVLVNGGPVQVPIVFTAATPPGQRYTVTFVEIGLPVETSWSATVRNLTIFSVTGNITFQEANGTSGFQIGAVPGYRAHPPAGSFLVNGAPVQLTIVFQPRTPPGARFTVLFVETGLPSGTNWSIVVANLSASSTTSEISFQETNGSHGFQVVSISGFRAQPPAGSVNVSGAPIHVMITFDRTTPPGMLYAVTFVESGLPAATNWSIEVRTVSASSVGGSLTFLETNGSYGYRVGAVPGFRPGAANIGFVVQGTPITVPVSFEVFEYTVLWKETGLWSGVSWGVAVNGTGYNDSGASVSARLPNGSYAYRVSGSTDFLPQSGEGTVLVAGNDTVVTVNFTRALFDVNFVERGLPPGLQFEIRFSSQTVPADGGPVEIAVLRAPIGTYNFDVIAPSGYYADPSHGNVTVQAQPTNLTISFFPIPSIWTLGPKAIVVGAVITLAAWGGFALFGRIRRPPRLVGANP